MATRVIYSNLFSASRNNVVELTTNNVSDPTTSSTEFRKWIYSREPDVKSNEFYGYPLIIIHPCILDVEKAEGSGDGKHKFVNFSIEVEIRSSDRGYSNNDGKGLSYLDSISNSFVETFNDITNRNSLALNSLEFLTPIVGEVGELTVADELIYRRIITLQFRSRMAVSS